MSISIRKADPSDSPGIHDLLSASDLTTEGVSEDASLVLVAGDAGRILGCVAIETDGADALLRSLAVSPEIRGTGMGKLLVSSVEEEARTLGITNLYLLTTTAVGFFGKLGYRTMERGQVPGVVRASAEFSACSSAGATAMSKVV